MGYYQSYAAMDNPKSAATEVRRTQISNRMPCCHEQRPPDFPVPKVETLRNADEIAVGGILQCLQL